MNLQIKKADRKQAKLRIGIFGASGSGKTMSALKLARGLTDNWSKVVVIDTENHSAELYSNLGEYNVLTLEAPFTPEKYIEAIKACEQAGMDVIVIDSITHEWAGSGGILELADTLGQSARNSFTVWGKLTPRHNKFIDAITQSSADIICCGRSKQDYALNQVEKNGKTVNVPEKIGLKSITRDGFDYEMTVSFDIAINHFASSTKDRTQLFKNGVEFIISEDTGKTIKEWNTEGKVDYEEIKRHIVEEIVRIIGKKLSTAEDYGNFVKKETKLTLKEDNFEKILLKLKSIETKVIEEIPEDNEEQEEIIPIEVETEPTKNENTELDKKLKEKLSK